MNRVNTEELYWFGPTLWLTSSTQTLWDFHYLTNAIATSVIQNDSHSLESLPLTNCNCTTVLKIPLPWDFELIWIQLINLSYRVIDEHWGTLISEDMNKYKNWSLWILLSVYAMFVLMNSILREFVIVGEITVGRIWIHPFDYDRCQHLTIRANLASIGFNAISLFVFVFRSDFCPLFNQKMTVVKSPETQKNTQI